MAKCRRDWPRCPETFAAATFGEAEVQDFRVTAFGHENICRFDIPVNNVFGVSGIECIGNFNALFPEGAQTPSVGQ